jgi:hypothetical protein
MTTSDTETRAVHIATWTCGTVLKVYSPVGAHPYGQDPVISWAAS